MIVRVFFFLFLLLFCQTGTIHAFDHKFEGRIWGAGQYYFGTPPAYKDVERDTQFRLTVLGNALKKDEWKLDYELTGDVRSVDGPSVQAGFNKDFDADFFRAWFRLGNDKFKVVGGRQKILFGSGALYRPLGFFDTRKIAGIVPLTRGMMVYYQTISLTKQPWLKPGRCQRKKMIR